MEQQHILQTMYSRIQLIDTAEYKISFGHLKKPGLYLRTQEQTQK